MFRAVQGNAFDTAIIKATDENLTSENWEYILDVCDKVGASDSGGRDAVVAMIKRLAHRNANVQLYTLELANALSQNCGNKIHREIASRSFTDALLRLTNDRNTHQQVKTKIYERMGDWSELFKRDPDLGIMDQAYQRLKSQNPGLQPPSKPFKQEITNIDRQKEEEELQMALALSLKEKPSSNTQSSTRSQDDDAPTTTQAQPSGTTAATVSQVRALYDFKPSEPGELEFRAGDIIAVLESVYKDWWKGSLRGNTGIFPLNYVEKLQDPTQEELQREAHIEAEVFGEIKNVERLLALLSTGSSSSNVQENDEITRLYQSVVAIRPKLVELIAKYSQKKDDFTQLNEKFIKARRDYESLLEASMSHPPPSQYGRPPQPVYSYGGGSYPPPQLQQPQQYYPAAPQSQEAQYPPARDGPAPFYMIPPSQQQQYAQQAPSGQPASANYIAPQTTGQSTFSKPQELPTSNYDPAQQTSSYPPPQAQYSQAQSGYGTQNPQQVEGSYQQQQRPQTQQTQYYPPQVAQASALTGSPAPIHDQVSSYPPPGQRQQYHEGGQQSYAQPSSGYPPGVAAGGDGEGDVSDYYR